MSSQWQRWEKSYVNKNKHTQHVDLETLFCTKRRTVLFQGSKYKSFRHHPSKKPLIFGPPSWLLFKQADFGIEVILVSQLAVVKASIKISEEGLGGQGGEARLKLLCAAPEYSIWKRLGRAGTGIDSVKSWTEPLAAKDVTMVIWENMNEMWKPEDSTILIDLESCLWLCGTMSSFGRITL